jgi:hypothetical protein
VQHTVLPRGAHIGPARVREGAHQTERGEIVAKAIQPKARNRHGGEGLSLSRHEAPLGGVVLLDGFALARQSATRTRASSQASANGPNRFGSPSGTAPTLH